MTERKPPGVSWETWIDRQIREAKERGEFDNLAGLGKPIANLGETHDELWWIRQLVQRENIETLPPALKLRKDRDAALAYIETLDTEPAVREVLEELNTRIRAINGRAHEGPPSNLMPVDIDAVVDRWRTRQDAAPEIL
ncbi:MAG TPA: DUF1992 domain-containing protein [Acidimicrobiales bacterium]|nr:DUF1992 domain-containing protein [Acidimicrobiales bacterium]